MNTKNQASALGPGSLIAERENSEIPVFRIAECENSGIPVFRIAECGNGHISTHVVVK